MKSPVSTNDDGTVSPTDKISPHNAISSETPTRQIIDVNYKEPISLHIRKAKKLVSVKAGSIAEDMTLFLAKRNEVYNINMTRPKMVSCFSFYYHDLYYTSLLFRNIISFSKYLILYRLSGT